MDSSDIETKHTPVNKGHFDLESDERISAYVAKLSHGWESEYNEYRKMWSELAKEKKIRDYPLLVDLELVSRCNLKCPMCPTITDEFKQKRIEPFRKGMMDINLAKKIIDEVSGKIYSLRLSWIGESTLHSGLAELIRYAKDRGIQETSFLTNGSKLKIEYFKTLVDAGIDQITISIDGMGETYDKIRKPLKFHETLMKLRDIKNFKDSNNLKKPVLKIQGVWPAIRENPELFYNTFSPLVDYVAYNALIDYLHNDKDIVYEEDFYCPQHYQRIVIGANGKAAMCSSDDFMDIDIGDANVQTIYEIWHGEKFKNVRKIHSIKDGFKELKPCKYCYYPRKMQVSETAIVNGREIQIENYINRKQIIGE